MADRLVLPLLGALVPCPWNLTIVLSGASVPPLMSANASRCNSATTHSQHARLGPAVERQVDCVLVAELARRAAPDGALVERVEPGVQHLEVGSLEVLLGGGRSDCSRACCASFNSFWSLIWSPDRTANRPHSLQLRRNVSRPWLTDTDMMAAPTPPDCADRSALPSLTVPNKRSEPSPCQTKRRTSSLRPLRMPGCGG